MPISLKRRGTLFVISAPSGGGKSTVLRALLQSIDGLSYSISVTSRKPRAGETPGKDYIFVEPEEFQRRIEAKDFYEWALVHGNYYGTLKSSVDEMLRRGHDVIMDLDVQGAYAIKGIRRDAVTIFLLPPSSQVLEERLRRRDTDDDEVIRLRLRNAADEIARCTRFDYLVVNQDLGTSITDIGRIVEAERHRGRRQTLLIENEPEIEARLGEIDAN